jgi:sigma-B regulation protein RsbU (phosphoserine phosphatase)
MSATADQGTAPARLLVVDDDENNRDMLSRRLARRGFDVEMAADGFQALDAINTAGRDRPPFDLVLLDIEMPGLSGLDVLRVVRERHGSTRLPIVIATARHDREDIVQAMGLGANDYVTKPLDFAVVLARVEAQLSHKRAVDRIVALEFEVRQRNEQLQRANDRMRHSLELAARVQRSLLPPEGPLRVNGVEMAWSFDPCDELGGDVLNAFGLTGGHVGFYVLDVSGHGVPSSLLSVTLSRLLAPVPGHPSLVERAHASGHLEPRRPLDVVEELNRRFPMGEGGGQYYGLLDPGNRLLRYVSAGHPPAVLVAAGDDRETRALEADGYAVGWFDEGDFQEHTVDLSAGDRLFVYSDGVTEAMDGSARHFGGERLAALLWRLRCDDLPACLAAVTAAIAEFRCGGDPLDDVTVLALEMPAP